MAQPVMSDHFKNRKPSSIRVAQLKFVDRTDGADDVNVAIGNVPLPMPPAMASGSQTRPTMALERFRCMQ